MGESARHLLVVARPRQWVKNAALFLPLFLNGKLFDPMLFGRVGIGVIVFCLLSSSNYIVNDILDVSSDREHPLKKNRPLAQSALNLTEAILAAIGLLAVGLIVAWTLGQSFFFAAVAFVAIHHLSNFYFRRIPVLDVLLIATGYVLRVIAGQYAAGASLSIWLFLTVLSASLLAAIGKRRSEFSLLQEVGGTIGKQMRGEFMYPEKVLDTYVAVFAGASFISYTYFTFLSTGSSTSFLFHGYADYLVTVLGRKWMMVTVP
jgi:decaprenyl-phosphate phosphoribosyltransferase